MAGPRDIRRCALQALYQLDVGNADEATIRESLAGSPGETKTHQKGFELALEAWGQHEQADAVVRDLAPDWPTYRQPVIDRCILRLAYFEMVTNRAPPKVVINEAVELAKEFSTDKSAKFVNGVLDKIYRSLREASENPAEAS